MNLNALTKRAIAGSVLLLCGLSVWFYFSNSSAPRPEIPLPDITTANVNVASLTNERYEQVKLNPSSAEAWGQYGEVLMAHEWNSEAINCFEVASNLAPTESRWLYLAGVMLDRRDPVEAVNKYEAAKQLDATYAPLYLRLGANLQRLNRLDDAEAAYRQAAKLSPQEPQPIIALARLESTRNKWQQAVDLLEQATKIAPANREALVELTRAKLVLGTPQSLSRETQAALMSGEKFEAMPDPILQSINNHENASRMAAMKADATATEGDPQKAAEAYSELIKQRPDLARPRINLATVYMAEGQFPLAMVTLRELVQLFPDDPMGHLLLSYALQATQATTEARTELETAIRLKPDYADAHFALGMAEEQNNEIDKAITAYRSAVQSNARHIQARTALGLALKKQGKWDEAIAELSSAVRLSPGDRVPQAYLEKAIAEQSAAKSNTDKPTP